MLSPLVGLYLRGSLSTLKIQLPPAYSTIPYVLFCQDMHYVLLKEATCRFSTSRLEDALGHEKLNSTTSEYCNFFTLQTVFASIRQPQADETVGPESPKQPLWNSQGVLWNFQRNFGGQASAVHGLG